MNVTDVTIINPIYRKYRKAITLRAALQRRADYWRKRDQLSESDEYRLRDVTVDLDIFISQLDNNEIISPPKWVEWPARDVHQYVFAKPDPGPAGLDPFSAALVDLMNHKGQKQRAATQSFFLQCALSRAHADGWALLFNTLTVSPEYYAEVFAPRSTAFKEYIRSFTRVATRAARRDAKETDHKYFAVVEEGGSTARLHIHVLHMTPAVLDIRDPNAGLAQPDRREVSSLKQLWPYGWSKPIAVRYSNGDAYSRIGWRWPYDRKTQKGIPTRQVGAIGGYMSKYILKSYTSQSRSNYLWRIRKTRNLGRETLDQLVRTLTTSTLLTIATCETIRTQINRQTIPPQALRLACLREYQARQSSETLFRSAKNLQPRASLLLSARASIQRSDECSPQNSGHSTTLTISAEDVFNAQAELDQAAAEIDAAWFPYSLVSPITLSTNHASN